MSTQDEPWDIEGPVQAEVFGVWLDDEDRIELAGPCGPDPWMLDLGRTEHPLAAVDRTTRDVVGKPLLVHSTSWRRDRDAVILSFLVVIDHALVDGMESRRVSGPQVDDRSYMRAMIPHHSIAILTSERSGIQDLRVRALADGIIAAQFREIGERDWLIGDIGENGPATTEAEAETRPVPTFGAAP